MPPPPPALRSPRPHAQALDVDVTMTEMHTRGPPAAPSPAPPPFRRVNHLKFPEMTISKDLKTFLNTLMHHKATNRLGIADKGAASLRKHPFFGKCVTRAAPPCPSERGRPSKPVPCESAASRCRRRRPQANGMQIPFPKLIVFLGSSYSVHAGFLGRASRRAGSSTSRRSKQLPSGSRRACSEA